MKSKIILCFVTLMLCMGIFSVTAFAAADAEPPTLAAWISGEILHIEANDAGTGVEAVFIGDKRVNYRVDSSLALSYKDYAGNDEYISVYAMDFAGNKSKVVQVKTPKTTESAAPSEQKPFTPAGTGTVMDNATDGDGKEFFTITTPDENVFYLIIDRQRNSENVYLLNAVTEDDLAALAKKSDKKPSESVVPTPDPKPTPTPEPEPEPQPEPKQSNNMGTIIFVLLAAAAVGGAGYYFKIYKPKQQASTADEYEEDEDMEFEDEDMSDDETFDGEDDDEYPVDPTTDEDTEDTDKEE